MARLENELDQVIDFCGMFGTELHVQSRSSAANQLDATLKEAHRLQRSLATSMLGIGAAEKFLGYRRPVKVLTDGERGAVQPAGEQYSALELLLSDADVRKWAR